MQKFRDARRTTIRAEWRGLSVITAILIAAAILMDLDDG
jgi:hypothetical protein